MPAKECDNGKWKWGESGECIYNSEQEANDANADYYDTEEAEEQKNLEPCEECVSDCAEGTCEIESASEENIKEQKSINIWDNKFNDSMEKRIINIETTLETREQEDGKQTDIVVGYGSVYNSRSNDLGGFYEYIAEGAISEDVINKSDVRALINHNMDKILARSVNGNGTLKLNTDSKGLRYEFEIPDTSYGRDLKVNMANGNLSQSSFAFTVADDDWSTDESGNNIRTITKIDRLFDISVVTYPAYSQAESDLVVAQRGLASYKETLKKEEEQKDLVMRSLASLKIELAKRK
jgi:HK97 family phage prohead protease